MTCFHGRLHDSGQDHADRSQAHAGQNPFGPTFGLAISVKNPGRIIGTVRYIPRDDWAGAYGRKKDKGNDAHETM